VELIDKAISELETDLKSYSNKEPSARRDPHEKTITITYYFGLYREIRCALIADRDNWVKLWEEADFNNLSLETLFSYDIRLSRKQGRKLAEVKAALAQYASENPHSFGLDIYNCALIALSHHPHYKLTVKRRGAGGTEYELNQQERWDIAATAIYLYLELKQWRHKHQEDRPAYIGKLLKTYSKSYDDLKLDSFLQEAVGEILSEYYGIEFSSRFWQTFVVESPLSIKVIRALKRRPIEENPFLEPLFREFLS
jgi:hypothetical protein